MQQVQQNHRHKQIVPERLHGRCLQASAIEPTAWQTAASVL